MQVGNVTSSLWRTAETSDVAEKTADFSHSQICSLILFISKIQIINSVRSKIWQN